MIGLLLAASVLINLCDAIVDELNLAATQASIGMVYNAERVYIPEFTLDELSGSEPKVLVAIRSLLTENITRGSFLNRTAYIDIGVLHKVPAQNDKDSLDELVASMQALSEHFQGWEYTAGYGVVDEVVNDPAYDMSALKDQACFRSIATLRIRMAQSTRE